MKYSSIFFTCLLLHVPVLCSLQGNLDSLTLKKRYYNICPKLCPTIKLLELKSWEFTRQTLCDVLPCAQQRKDFFGITNGVLFSDVVPVLLTKDLKLAAVSGDVLANILDLNPNNINSSEYPSFVDFASGKYVLPTSIPIAHRYGGHQVSHAFH